MENCCVVSEEIIPHSFKTPCKHFASLRFHSFFSRMLDKFPTFPVFTEKNMAVAHTFTFPRSSIMNNTAQKNTVQINDYYYYYNINRGGKKDKVVVELINAV